MLSVAGDDHLGGSDFDISRLGRSEARCQGEGWRFVAGFMGDGFIVDGAWLVSFIQLV